MFLFWGAALLWHASISETDVLREAINLLNPVSLLNKMSPFKESPVLIPDRSQDAGRVPSNSTTKRVSRMTVSHFFGDLIWNYLENVMEGEKKIRKDTERYLKGFRLRRRVPSFIRLYAAE